MNNGLPQVDQMLHNIAGLLGPPNKDIPRPSTWTGDTKFVENLTDLYEPWLGSNPTIASLFQERIQLSDAWELEVFPKRMTPRLKISFTRYIFPNANLTRTAHQAAPRIVNERTENYEITLYRFGLGVEIEDEAYMTAEGSEIFIEKLRTIEESVLIHAQKHTVISMVESYDLGVSTQTAYGKWDFETFSKVMTNLVTSYCSLAGSDNEHAVSRLINSASSRMANAGVRPDTIVLPPGLLTFIKNHPNTTNYSRVGPDRNVSTQVIPHILNSAPEGVRMVTAGPYVTEEERSNPLVTNSKVLEFYPMLFPESDPASCKNRDILIHGFDGDCMRAISFMHALEHSRMFKMLKSDPHEEGYSDDVHGFIEKMNSMEEGMSSHFSHESSHHGNNTFVFAGRDKSGRYVPISVFGQMSPASASQKDFEITAKSIIKNASRELGDLMGLTEKLVRVLENIESEPYNEEFFVALVKTNAPLSTIGNEFVGQYPPKTRNGPHFNVRDFTPNRYGGLDLPSAKPANVRYPPGFNNGPGLYTIAAEAHNKDSPWYSIAIEIKDCIDKFSMFIRRVKDSYLPTSGALGGDIPSWFHADDPFTGFVNMITNGRNPIFLKTSETIGKISKEKSIPEDESLTIKDDLILTGIGAQRFIDLVEEGYFEEDSVSKSCFNTLSNSFSSNKKLFALILRKLIEATAHAKNPRDAFQKYIELLKLKVESGVALESLEDEKEFEKVLRDIASMYASSTVKDKHTSKGTGHTHIMRFASKINELGRSLEEFRATSSSRKAKTFSLDIINGIVSGDLMKSKISTKEDSVLITKIKEYSGHIADHASNFDISSKKTGADEGKSGVYVRAPITMSLTLLKTMPNDGTAKPSNPSLLCTDFIPNVSGNLSILESHPSYAPINHKHSFGFGKHSMPHYAMLHSSFLASQATQQSSSDDMELEMSFGERREQELRGLEPTSRKKTRIEGMMHGGHMYLHGDHHEIDPENYMSEVFEHRLGELKYCSNKLTALIIACIYSTHCHNIQNWFSLSSNGGVAPGGIILVRCIKQDCSSAILLKSGEKTGVNFFGPHAVRVGSDANTGRLGLSTTFYHASAVVNAKNIDLLPNVKPDKYKGGSNTKFVSSPSDFSIEHSHQDQANPAAPSIISMFVPASHKDGCSPISIVGKHPTPFSELQADNTYPTSHFYNQIYGFSDVFYTKSICDLRFDTMESMIFPTVYQGLYLTYNSNTKCYDIVHEGNGHRAGKIYPGCAPVWDGNGVFKEYNWAAFKHTK